MATRGRTRQAGGWADQRDASRVTVGPNRLGEAVTALVESYGLDVARRVDAASKEAVTELVRETRRTAPVGSRERHYRSTIYGKLLRDDGLNKTFVWHARDYRLSHLLEHNHATGPAGARGHARGTGFIQAAWRRVEPAYVAKVRRAIADAS